MNPRRKISIHQALHGYRDGHEMIAGSIELPKVARRQMLVLSDLSGDEPLKGFRQYFTGYPVADTDYYALAQTWYAHEMSRPGCVWTHSLLVERTQLVAGLTPAMLLPLFRRPKTKVQPSTYSKPVSIDIGEADAVDLPLPEDLEIAVMAALYGDPNSEVVVPARSSEPTQDSVLDVWWRQWPALRGNFRFCTGALSRRRDGEHQFDLQVVPVRVASRLKRRRNSADSIVVVDPASPERLEASTVAIREAILGEESDQLFRRYGQDLPGTRRAFGVFLEVVDVLRSFSGSSDSADRVVELLGTAFPSRKSAKELKRAVVGRRDDSKQSELGVGVLGENAKLLALLRTNQTEAFDLDDLRLESRLADALNGEAAGQFSIIETVVEGQELSAAGKEICSRALSSLTTRRLITLHAHNRALVRNVLTLSPERMETTDVWDGPREFQRTCLDLVTERGGLTPQVVRAMVQASGFSLVREVGAGWDSATADVVLSELNGLAGEEKLGGTIRAWVNGLESASGAVAQWLGVTGRTVSHLLLVALAERMTPRWPPLASLPSEVLMEAVEKAAGLKSSAITSTVALVIALQRNEKSGARIVARTFEEVHQALMKSALPWSAWQWLDSELPRDRWALIWDWDRAGRLRKGLVQAFIEHRDWEADELKSALHNPTTRNYVVSLCEQTGKGRRLLDRAGLR